MRAVTGHQPVYLPWLGLLHKISLADLFVFMDDVQYLRQDWNNRNKIRGAKGEFWLTVPVKLKASDTEILRDIRVETDGFGGRHHWQTEHWQAFQSCYRKAPFWEEHAPFLERFYTGQSWEWLWELNLELLVYLLKAFDLTPTILIASEVGFDGAKSDLVLDHCRRTEADLCVLGMLGRDYIEEETFFREGIFLYYQDYHHPEYSQRFGGFISHLSAFDLLLNHGPESRKILLKHNVTRDDLEQEASLASEPRVLRGDRG